MDEVLERDRDCQSLLPGRVASSYVDVEHTHVGTAGRQGSGEGKPHRSDPEHADPPERTRDYFTGP